MATRGRKPKPPHLRLVLGGKTSTKSNARRDATTLGPAVKPKGLTAAASKCWDRTISRAHWLTYFDSDKAALWAFLQAEFEGSKGAMIAARIGQLRALGSELGLDPASRTRLGVTATQPAADALDEFFARHDGDRE